MTDKKKENKELLPDVDKTQFLADPTVWDEIRTETQRLIPLIEQQGDDLSPEEFKKVKQLAKNVRDHVTKYRAEVKKQTTIYKERIETELDAIDYGKIESYMTKRREENQKEVSDRLNEQLSIFNRLVAEELSKTNHIKSSSLASQVSNLLMKRFPNVNSGAKSKEIKKWNPIESVIRLTITKVDEVMMAQPLIQQLPAHSTTMRQLGRYLAEGDDHILDNVSSWLEDDKAIIQRLVLKSRVETADDTVNEMKAVLATESISSDVMIERVRLLLSVYDANK